MQEADSVSTQGVMEQVPEVVDELFGVLAERFGATGAHLWELMVRQVYVEAVTGGLILGVLVVCWFGTYMLFKRAALREEQQGNEREARDLYGVSLGVFIAGGAAFFLGLLFTLPDIVTAVVNPEYRALDEVLDMLSRRRR